MNTDQALELVMQAGYDAGGHLDPATFRFREEVRDMCKADLCHSYGTRWVCPPACGSLEELATRCHPYKDGMAFQTICKMQDEYDLEVYPKVRENFRNSFNKLLDSLYETGEDFFMFGLDACGNCKECTYPDAPCRFPDRAFPSLEACGLVVSDTCRANRVKYYYGKNIVAFTGAFLFNPER